MAKGLRDIHYHLIDIFKKRGVGNPITLDEIRTQLPGEVSDQSDLPRRIREVRSFGGYDIPYSKATQSYALQSAKPKKVIANPDPISGRDAARVRLDAHGRCQMCGKTIKEDGIKLVIDHRIPREWGGPSELNNYWAICEPCNIAKRDFFATLPQDIMKKCMKYELPIQRIGELLKVFEGKIVPRYLLVLVGMEDEWTRRLRELRDLGWKVKYKQVKGEKGASRHSYKLLESKPWPKDIKSAIAAAAKKRGSKSFGG